jgi:uncharacterized protein (DUF433 family)
MNWYDDHITRIPGVQGGEPVVVGTRTPVRTIAILYHETYAYDLAKVLASLPHLTSTQVDAALAYYRDHRAEIDALSARHREASKGLIGAP